MYELLWRPPTVFVSIIIFLLLVAAIVWLGRMGLRKRRRARAVAELAKYRPSGRVHEQPNQSISVDELVARTLAEGRSVRLNWEGSTTGEMEACAWPTAVVPRVEPEE